MGSRQGKCRKKAQLGRQALRILAPLRDNGAELGVAVLIFPAEFVRTEVDLREEALEGAFEGFVFDVFETRLQGIEQITAIPS